MAVDLNSLETISRQAVGLGNLVLVQPKAPAGYRPQLPPNSVGQNPYPKLMFHIEGENKVTLQNDIGDHYVEDNTAIQDTIARKPKKVTVFGFIGEVNTVPPPGLDLARQYIDRLPMVGGFQPELTAGAILAYNAAVEAARVALAMAGAAVNAWNSITAGDDGSPVQNLQQKMFAQFEGYYDKNQLFTVDTPWRAYKNMAIETLTAIQDESTRLITSFEVTFKEIRFVEDVLEIPKPTITKNLRAADGSGLPVDHGFSVPTSGPEFGGSDGFGSLIA